MLAVSAPLMCRYGASVTVRALTYALTHLTTARTADARCAMKCLVRPSNPVSPLLDIQKGESQKALPFLWSRRRDSNPRPLGPEPRRRTLSFAGFITKTVRLYRGASSSRKTLLRNLFREPFTVLARLASGPLVNSYHTDHKKGRVKKLSLFCGRGDGIRALGGRARKTADVCCFVVGRYLRPAQAMLAGLPSNPVSPLLDIQKRESQKALPFLWSRRRDSNPRPLGPEPSALPSALRLVPDYYIIFCRSRQLKVNQK